MQIVDEIWGEFEVNEPVLIELLQSKELNRLRHISSAGYYPAIAENTHPQNTRYIHSVGVFLLLRRFGAPLLEQIAGLLHDVSHSAFSHTIDYIKTDLDGQKTQSAQDAVHEKYLQKTSIPSILQKYGINLADILDDKKFPLKENDLPNICADRLDYTMRNIVIFNLLSQEEIAKIRDSLIVANGSFVFENAKGANLFCNAFYFLNEHCWSGFPSAIMFAVSARLFRRALNLGIVSLADFYDFDDDYIIKKIQENLDKDKKLKAFYDQLNLPPKAFENDLEAPIEPIFTKNRIVNPFVRLQDTFCRFADMDQTYKSKISKLPKFKEYRVVLNKFAKVA